MLATHKLTAQTLVAQDGGKTWEPLRLLAIQRQHNITPCPYCQNALLPELHNKKTEYPTQCPHCLQMLRPEHPNSICSCIAHNWYYRLFSFRGRASRRMFLSNLILLALLFFPVVLISFFLSVSIENILDCAIPDISSDNVLLTRGILLAIWGGYATAICSICTRRLHDIGSGAKLMWVIILPWMVMAPVSFLLGTCGIIWIIKDIFGTLLCLSCLIWLIVLIAGCSKTGTNPNKFGPPTE